LIDDPLVERVSDFDSQALAGVTHCLIVEYEAEALFCPDPEWRGKEVLTLEQRNAEYAFLANLALWLQRPCPISFTLFFHMSEFLQFAIQGAERAGGFLCHPHDEEYRIGPDDLLPAKALFAAMRKIPRETALWTTLRCTSFALQNNLEEIRYLLLWVALESLFGASTEVTFRISQRIALFIGTDRVEAHEIFDRARKAYAFRSRVAHGAWKADSNSTALTSETETMLRRALNKLLSNSEMAAQFLGKNEKREEFLDHLVFG
jgi:hypothetical protein